MLDYGMFHPSETPKESNILLSFILNLYSNIFKTETMFEGHLAYILLVF